MLEDLIPAAFCFSSSLTDRKHCSRCQGYLISPFLAYNFSELIESHAVDTYTEFAEVNKELLKSLPPTPQVMWVSFSRSVEGNTCVRGCVYVCVWVWVSVLLATL